MGPAPKFKNRIINQSALKEINYEPNKIPRLTTSQTNIKKKGELSINKMKEQYQWLHNSITSFPATKTRTKEKVKILAIDRASLIIPKVTNEQVSSPSDSIISKPNEATSEQVSFLLQFNCKFIYHISTPY